MSFEVEPAVSPAFFAMRVKGRLEHAMRQSGNPVQWSRKVGMRSLGENTDSVVERYLSLQQKRGDFADPQYARTLAEFSREFPTVRLEDPAESARGRYWYNLHLVAVTGSRWRIGREDFLPRLASAIPEWANEEEIALKSMSFMPDHVHLAFRGNPLRSPAEIAEGCWRALNRASGLRLFSDRVYVGSFSSYSRQSIQV
jgi:REP element-mobilizing transposase RayT